MDITRQVRSGGMIGAARGACRLVGTGGLPPPELHLASGLNLFGRYAAALAAWSTRALARRRQRLDLGELDERLLKDIGLNRCQAKAEAAKPFWRG